MTTFLIKLNRGTTFPSTKLKRLVYLRNGMFEEEEKDYTSYSRRQMQGDTC